MSAPAPLPAPVASPAAFAELLVAARLLAGDPGAAATLARLASRDTARRAWLAARGQAALAAAMARRAAEADAAFAHPGPRKEDARLLFGQVAPVALADPAALAAPVLDPAAALDRMLAAVAASPLGRDFARTELAAPYLRAVAAPALALLAAAARPVNP